MQILASFEPPKFGSEGRPCLRSRSRYGPCPLRQAADGSDPISPTIDRDGLSSSAALPYAGERIFMRHHNMWVSAFGSGVGLSGVPGPQNGGYAGL
jgi:hypothetical protein